MKTGSFPYAFFDGKVVKIEDAKVSIMTNALQYGTAIFGGIRGYYNAEEKSLFVFRLDDHTKRFLSSVKILGCSFPYSQEQLKKIILDLIKKNNPTTNCYLRPFGYVGNTELGPNFANTTLDFSLHMIPLEEYMPVSKGLSLNVSSWQRISDNAIPTRAKISGGYANSALARKEATDGGFDEAILLNSRGYVSEGSAENIFLVRDGKLITPGLSEGVLEGITRRSVMQMAKDMEIVTIER
ncbi:MAG TPA: branched-chain amino acid transaminase, partial [Candidatus Saccharimonadales bacterium]|nr:branched-chain amino acid transaminase [Candidatus Saccharimonadales bacterium]